MPDISDSDKERLIRLRTELFDRELEGLAKRLRDGTITLGMWEEDFRTRLRQFMSGIAMISAGGPDKMTPSLWGRVGSHFKKQLKWLHDFAKDIYEKRKTVTEAAIAARSKLYAKAGGKLAVDIQAGDYRDYLTWLPKDGSTLCLNGCLCSWVQSINASSESEKTVTSTWTLSPAEHCDTCISRDGYVEVHVVPIGMSVPPVIGYGG